jgi:hypothetical protein
MKWHEVLPPSLLEVAYRSQADAADFVKTFEWDPADSFVGRAPFFCLTVDAD